MDFNGNEDMNIMEGYLTLQERVYEILRDNILSGKLPPNASLNTSQLSMQMHVSRTPVRDAVNKLVSIGLAVKVSHREARVADFMTDEMNEVFKARSALEGIAAHSAAKYMAPEEKELLKNLSDRFEECYLAKDEVKFKELDQEYHFLIYKSMRTATLKDIACQLYMMTKGNRDAGYHIEGRGEQILEEHKALTKAIYHGNAEEAEKIGSNHHFNAITNMQKMFEQLKQETVQKDKNNEEVL